MHVQHVIMNGKHLFVARNGMKRGCPNCFIFIVERCSKEI